MQSNPGIRVVVAGTENILDNLYYGAADERAALDLALCLQRAHLRSLIALQRRVPKRMPGRAPKACGPAPSHCLRLHADTRSSFCTTCHGSAAQVIMLLLGRPCKTRRSPSTVGALHRLMHASDGKEDKKDILVPPTGNQKSMLITNCLFRLGGVAALLSNRPGDARSAKYRLDHVVRTHLGADDVAYKCVHPSVHPSVHRCNPRVLDCPTG